jgi:hypothetical protein
MNIVMPMRSSAPRRDLHGDHGGGRSHPAWGVNIGIAGFAVGLLSQEALPKQIFTPIMGTALLIGIAAYLRDVTGTGNKAT